MFLLPAITHQGHELQDLLSSCDGILVCTDLTSVYSLIRKSFGGMESEPMLTPREKSPLPEKFSSERTHDAASSRTASPTHYQQPILVPASSLKNIQCLLPSSHTLPAPYKPRPATKHTCSLGGDDAGLAAVAVPFPCVCSHLNEVPGVWVQPCDNRLSQVPTVSVMVTLLLTRDWLIVAVHLDVEDLVATNLAVGVFGLVPLHKDACGVDGLHTHFSWLSWH